MSVDHYACTDMRKILINIIEIHMNVRCAEMMSREITYLKMVKTFFTIKTICIQRRSTIPSISTKRMITSHLKSSKMSKNCLLSLAKQFVFPHLKYIKFFLSGLRVMETQF
jgi:hypothetical protein